MRYDDAYEDVFDDAGIFFCSYYEAGINTGMVDVEKDKCISELIDYRVFAENDLS